MRWWRDLRQDRLLPAWFRAACLAAAALTFYAWFAQLLLLNVYVDPVPCDAGHKHWFIDLTGPYQTLGPVVAPEVSVTAAVLSVLAMLGFLLTAVARSQWNRPFLWPILACVGGLIALPLAYGQVYLQGFAASMNAATLGEPWTRRMCDAGGPGLFEDTVVMLPLLYPVLVVALAVLARKTKAVETA